MCAAANFLRRRRVTRLHILIADKNQSVRALVSTRLTARHYTVTEMDSSPAVLEWLDAEKPDLLLVATNMERVGGRMLIEKIRHKSHLGAVPVILMAEEKELSDLLMSHDRGYDDFLIKPFSGIVLQLRVALNLSRLAQRMEANALTHLPGNHAIERYIQQKIERSEKFSVLYIDINHFKSFNDRYGFQKGDDVIRHTAKILQQTLKLVGAEGQSFLGHIGGDDFVVVVTPDKEEVYARTFIAEFDRIMSAYYNEADRKRGTIRVTNRQGKLESMPLMSCSVSATTNLVRDYKNLGEIAQDVAEVKQFLKSQTGSHYLRDRRATPIVKLEDAVEILAPEVPVLRQDNGAEPLGKVLVEAGLISEDQLTAGLKKHFESGHRLGQVLVTMKAVKSEELGRVLEKKLNVPYVNLRRVNPKREILRLFSLEFIRTHRVLPLESREGRLRLAMCDPFDLRTLDAISRITGLKPSPSLALEEEFSEFVAKHEAHFLQAEKTG